MVSLKKLYCSAATGIAALLCGGHTHAQVTPSATASVDCPLDGSAFVYHVPFVSPIYMVCDNMQVYVQGKANTTFD